MLSTEMKSKQCHPFSISFHFQFPFYPSTSTKLVASIIIIIFYKNKGKKNKNGKKNIIRNRMKQQSKEKMYQISNEEILGNYIRTQDKKERNEAESEGR